MITLKSFKYALYRVLNHPSLLLRPLPHILDLGSKFKIEFGRSQPVPCSFIINKPTIVDFGSEFEINQDLSCEGEFEEE